MKEKYIKIKNLSVSEKLVSFVNNELLPGTNVSKEKFWSGFDKCIHELSPKNKKILDLEFWEELLIHLTEGIYIFPELH